MHTICPDLQYTDRLFMGLRRSRWEGVHRQNIYIYTMDSNDCIQTYKSRGPVLCCDFTSDTSACSGGLDTDVKMSRMHGCFTVDTIWLKCKTR